MSGARASGGADTTEATRTSGMSNRLARDQPRNCQLGLPIASIAVVLVDSSRAQDSQQVVEPQGLGRQTSPPGKGADGKGAFSSFPHARSCRPDAGRLPSYLEPRRCPKVKVKRALGVLRKAQVQTTVARIQPARGDDLAPREEVHALDAMGMGVTEQRVLPATERVVGHRHRDRHVDADHADLHLVLELPRGATVVGEDRHAIAVRVVVDQLYTLVVAV